MGQKIFLVYFVVIPYFPFIIVFKVVALTMGKAEEKQFLHSLELEHVQECLLPNDHAHPLKQAGDTAMEHPALHPCMVAEHEWRGWFPIVSSSL